MPPIRYITMAFLQEFSGRVDREQIRAFLTRSIPEQVHLVSISSVDGTIQGRDFGQDYDAALAWVIAQNERQSNIYFSPNEVKAGLHKQPQKSDIKKPRLVSVDIDPPKGGGTFDKEGMLRRLPAAFSWTNSQAVLLPSQCLGH